ncbi:MAG: diguanylate cyclase [Desulfamplus sp.]|nr:diguanylate cyclase [Desulfamplus sp.]
MINELLNSLKTQEFVRIQREFNRYDGTSFILDGVFSKVRNLKGEIIGYVANLRDNTEIYRKATTDMLTQIYNRAHFEELARHEINNSLRYKKLLSFILCDIDHFKKVNDTYGHLCGDLVLKELASEIKNMLRDSDIFARVGGEEFAILLPVTNKKAAYHVAEKIRDAIEKKTFIYDGNEFQVTMSFGISELNTKIDRVISLKELLGLADKRLYSSKEHGRNRITY